MTDRRALARHQQQCENVGHSWDDLHRLAGRYDAYPSPAPTTPEACVCGAALPPLALYCSDACRKAAQNRALGAIFQRHNEPEIQYSFEPPRRR